MPNDVREWFWVLFRRLNEIHAGFDPLERCRVGFSTCPPAWAAPIQPIEGMP